MTLGELNQLAKENGLPDSTKIVTYNPSGSYGESSIWTDYMVYVADKDFFLEQSIAKPGAAEFVIVVS